MTMVGTMMKRRSGIRHAAFVVMAPLANMCHLLPHRSLTMGTVYSVLWYWASMPSYIGNYIFCYYKRRSL
jgi:hypothetical protein